MRAAAFFLLLPLVACHGADVSSEAEAELAYLGLDAMIEKAMTLGFDGFNGANSANIDEQSAAGDVSGTLRVNGQVDQGASANKGMRLTVALEDYSDGAVQDADGVEFTVTYATDATALPAFDLSLRDIPSGTLEGTLVGEVQMDGDLTGAVLLDIALSGAIEPDGGGVGRVAGATHVTGTATSSGDVFDIDLMR